MSKPKIISDLKILGGKPIIAGTRISVELILDKLTAGMSEKEILEDYPHLTINQIEAAIGYAKSLVNKKRASLGRKTELTTLYTHEISR